MRALVTGGAGFIGSTLVDRLLAEDYTVDVVDDLSRGTLTNLADARRDHPRQLTFHRLDIGSPDMVEVMRRRRPDVVYHLAGRSDIEESVDDAYADAEVNLLGALRVIDGARHCGAGKVVVACSSSIYGAVRPSDLPVRESHTQRPETPHGVAKRAVADYLWTYRQLHNLEFTALVLANVYGPRQSVHAAVHPARQGVGPAESDLPRAGGSTRPGTARSGSRSSGPVVATFAARLVSGELCTIEGGGRQTRDFVFVDDVVDAFARAARRGGGLLLNVGTGIETSITALYHLVSGAAGVDREAVPGPVRPGDQPRMSLDPARAEIHLGWKSWTPVEEGVGNVVEALAGRGG